MSYVRLVGFIRFLWFLCSGDMSTGARVRPAAVRLQNREVQIMSDEMSQSNTKETTTSTIKQPEAAVTLPTEKPSQAEGDRDTVEEDLQDEEQGGTR